MDDGKKSGTVGPVGGYVELYKKYRPRTWSEVVGQDGVVTDVRGAVANNRVPTAYLFAGPRGCGKTTVAYILAKALNCEKPDGQGNPCNECSTCMMIDSGTCPGVHYISAANNPSVDNIREITNEAYRMSTVRRPVWIIDEMQRLSIPAFDALLIPLENKSIPSTFIFCTTEIDRIPDTLISRMQPRAFRLVPRPVLAELCKRVLGLEGFTRTDDAAYTDAAREDEALPYDQRRHLYSTEMIMRTLHLAGVTSGGGSARQALGALDRMISSPSTNVHDWPGLIAADIFASTQRSPRADAPKALTDIGKAINDGSDAAGLTIDLIGKVREMIVLLHVTDGDDRAARRRLSVAREIGDTRLLRCFDALAVARRDQMMESDARIHLEAAVIRICLLLKAA